MGRLLDDDSIAMLDDDLAVLFDDDGNTGGSSDDVVPPEPKAPGSIVFGTVPTPAITAAFEADTVNVVRWMDIYQADNTTLWKSHVPVTEGNVSVDMARDERRNLDITLYDDDDSLGYGPGQLWYDKVFKPYRGIVLPDYEIPGYLYLPGLANNAVTVNRAIQYYTPAINLTGAVGSYVSTSSSSALNVSGDLDIMVRFALADWTPGTLQTLVAKWVGVGNQSWRLRIETTGFVTLSCSTDGTAVSPATSTAAPVVADTRAIWIRCLRIASTGNTSFWTASDSETEPVTWNTLTLNRVTTAGALFSSAADVTIGAHNNGATSMTTGKVMRVIIKPGSGQPKIADFNPAEAGTGSTSWTGSVGNVWTLHGDAQWITTQVGFPGGTLPSVTQADFAVRISLDTLGASQPLAGWNGGGGGLTLTSANKLNVGIAKTTSGTIGGADSSVAVPNLTIGTKIWLRGVVVVSTAVCTYYYSFDDTNDVDMVTWIAVGTAQTGSNAGGTVDLTKTATPIFGSTDLATAGFTGKLWAAYEAINTAKTVELETADFDATSTTFRAVTGQTASIIKSGTIPAVARFVAKNMHSGDTWVVCLGEFLADVIDRPRFPQTIHLTGRDFVKKLKLSKFAVTTSFAVGANVVDTIKTIALNGGITKFNFPTSTKTLGSVVTFDRGSERWTAISNLATSIGMEVFFDNYGSLTLRPFVDPLLAPLTYTFKTGATSNLIDYNRNTTDVRLFNKVVVYGDAPDNPLITGEAANTTSGSPTNIASIGERLLPVPNSFVTNNTDAAALALSILKVSALEQYEVASSAIVIPWIEAGSAVEMLVSDAAVSDPTRFLFTDFTIPLALTSMDGTARRVTLVA